MELTDEDKALALSIRFDHEAIAITKQFAGTAPLDRLLGYDDNFDDVHADGFSFNAPDGDRQEHFNIVDALDKDLAPAGYAAFLTEKNRLSETERAVLHEYIIGVVRRDDRLAAVKIRNTSGFNYDLTNAAIVERLAEWIEGAGVAVIGADYDWVTLRFDTLPRDLKSFTRDVFDFCPDTVAQGTAPLYESLDDTGLREQGYTLEAGMDPEEGGLALLMQDLSQTKLLSLWWD